MKIGEHSQDSHELKMIVSTSFGCHCFVDDCRFHNLHIHINFWYAFFRCLCSCNSTLSYTHYWMRLKLPFVNVLLDWRQWQNDVDIGATVIWCHFVAFVEHQLASSPSSSFVHFSRFYLSFFRVTFCFSLPLVCFIYKSKIVLYLI